MLVITLFSILLGMVLLPIINTFLAQENFLTKLKYYDYENCGKSRQTKQKYYILKGNTIKIEDAPWTVAIAEKQGLCTGTLISKKHVLTAFHCFKSQNIKTIRKTMKFVMNGTCLPLNAEDKDCKINEHYIFRKAARVMFSENYNEEKSDNDYAIVELDEEVPFNEHACLPFLHNQPTENYESLKAIGYGAVLLDDGTIGMNGKLQEYIYPMEPSAISNCSARVNTNNTYNMFRVFVPGTGGICFGDSGGPIGKNLPNTTDRFTILGVTSSTEGACLSLSGMNSGTDDYAVNRFVNISCFANEIYNFMRLAN